METNRITNQPVILITGASSGIGEATARRFASSGYNIVLVARRQERLQALAQEMQSLGAEALVIPADVANLEDIQRVAQLSLAQYGRIDVLFNNAGFGRLKWLDQLDPLDEIAYQLQVDLLGLIQMTRAVLPYMIERRSGQIINMASVAGLIGTPTYSIYAAAKFGVRGFSEALRREVGVYGIRVSVIYPGAVTTEFKELSGADRKSGITTPENLRLSAGQVAEEIFSLVKRPRRSVVIPWFYRPAVWFNASFPGVVDWLIERRFTRRER